MSIMNVLCRKSWQFIVLMYFVALTVADGKYFLNMQKTVFMVTSASVDFVRFTVLPASNLEFHIQFCYLFPVSLLCVQNIGLTYTKTGHVCENGLLQILHY